MRAHQSIYTLVFCSLWLAGCGQPVPIPAAKTTGSTSSGGLDSSSAEHGHGATSEHSHDDSAEHGHSHERGKLLIADAGKDHFLLTAHLSKEGNELEIFVETPVTDNPQPAAISVAGFEAQATVGEGDVQVLRFEPASVEERPKGERAGSCSHFVAKADWLQPTDKLYVVARLTVEGEDLTARWRDFIPSKYAHHLEQ